MNGKSTVTIMLLLLLALFSGCASANGESGDGAVSGVQGSEVSAAVDGSEAEYSVTIETTDGERVTFESKPLVAVTDTGSLDIMDALGHRDYIIGVVKSTGRGASALTGDLEAYLDDYYLDVSTIQSEEGEDVDTYANLRNANPALIIAGTDAAAGENEDASVAKVSDIAPTLAVTTDTSEYTNSVIGTVLQKIDNIVKVYGGEEAAQEYIDVILGKQAIIKEAVGDSTMIVSCVHHDMLTLGWKGRGSTATLLTTDLGFTSLVDLTKTSNNRAAGVAYEDAEQSEALSNGEEAEQAENQAQNSRSSETISGEMITALNPEYFFVVRYDENTEEEEEHETIEEMVAALGLENTGIKIVYLDASWSQSSIGVRALISMLDEVIAALGIA